MHEITLDETNSPFHCIVKSAASGMVVSALSPIHVVEAYHVVEASVGGTDDGAAADDEGKMVPFQ